MKTAGKRLFAYFSQNCARAARRFNIAKDRTMTVGQNLGQSLRMREIILSMLLLPQNSSQQPVPVKAATRTPGS